MIDKWQAGDFELIVCPQLIHEVRKGLLSPRLAERYRILASDAEAFARRLEDEGVMRDDPQDPPRAVPDDPGDDYLVALALASEARTLVTRDRHFEKVSLAELRIVGPREALELLDA